MHSLIEISIKVLLVYGLSTIAFLLFNFTVGIVRLTKIVPPPTTTQPMTISPDPIPTQEPTINSLNIVQFPGLPDPWDEPMQYTPPRLLKKSNGYHGGSAHDSCACEEAPHAPHTHLRLLPAAPELPTPTTKKKPRTTTKKSTTTKTTNSTRKKKSA